MMNKNERMNKLNAMGINTSKYFTVDLDNGTKVHLIIDENGNVTKANDPIAEQIIEDGYVRNTKLHRRFVMAQMFHMINWKSWDGKCSGYNDCLKRMYGYNYMFDMMLEEVRVLSKLEAKDVDTFNERAHFFTKEVIIAVMEDYLEKLKAYVDKLPNKNCKGVPYKRVKGENIFVADLHKKIYAPVEHKIWKMKYVKSAADAYKVLSDFMNKRTFIKLPYETAKSKAWIDAFKGNGSYYTLKNLLMFNECFVETENGIKLYGVKAVDFINSKLDEYSGEGWRMFALMKKVINDNNFDFNKRMEEIYGGKSN